jgi:hypothetical protein
VVEDPYGFDFDPAEVTAHRDDEVEYSLSNSRGQHRDPRKGRQIQARMAAREKTFICPPGYTERENRKDQRRLEELTRKRSRKPIIKLTKAEEAEEIHLMGRAMAYRLGPEPTARKRIDELRRQRLSGMQRLSGIPESAAEQSELAELEQRYPSVIDIDIDPPRPEDHRLFEALEGSRKAVEQARREQAEALSRGEDPRKRKSSGTSTA